MKCVRREICALARKCAASDKFYKLNEIYQINSSSWTKFIKCNKAIYFILIIKI